MTAPVPSQVPAPMLNAAVDRPLPADGHVGVGVAVVLVGDVDVRPGEDVVADLNRVVRNDMAAAPDHAPVADSEHRNGAEIVARRHARAQRDQLGDHALVADLDPALAVDGAGREGHQRAGPESREPAAGGGLGSHGPGLLHAAPGTLNGAGAPAPGGACRAHV